MTESIALVAGSWRRIEAWLREHAPATFAALNPPADRAAISSFEDAVGVRLPPDVTASLLVHDGCELHAQAALCVVGEYALLDLAWMGKVRRNTLEVGESADAAEGEESMTEWWWRPEWIPLARPNWDGALFADRDGEIWTWSSEGAAERRVASSFGELLADTADLLEGVRLDRELRPTVRDGRLVWDSAE